MLLDRLPGDLENADALIERRGKAAEVKELWRSIYTDAYQYACPTRETFTWTTPGQPKERRLYDSTLQEATYTAANTMIATVFPPWRHWCKLSPGGAFFGLTDEEIPHELVKGLQNATEVFFNYLDHSNFQTVVNEAALDLMIGTGSIDFDEGDDDNPFVFSSIALSAIEVEEGPSGAVETTWMCRKIKGRNLVRAYPGLDEFDLPESLRKQITDTPDKDVEVIQGCIFHPGSKNHYGVALTQAPGVIFWRYNYGPSSPRIVARANKVTGETYGRGRVLLALSDARTLDKMVEYILKHSALQIAPPMTGVSDGVLNPYTAVLAPATILPVASNDNGNPSLRPIQVGGNFLLGEALVEQLRERVRRTMLGPPRSDGPVKTATEIMVNDRDRLWSMGGESGRVQVELLARVVHRGIYILQKRGLIPQFKIDGRQVTISFTSPFANSQSAEDVMALERVLGVVGALGPQISGPTLQIGLKVEDIPDWTARKTGLDMAVVNSRAERAKLKEDAAGVAETLVNKGAEEGVL
jgi:hypothetical protein